MQLIFSDFPTEIHMCLIWEKYNQCPIAPLSIWHNQNLQIPPLQILHRIIRRPRRQRHKSQRRILIAHRRYTRAYDNSIKRVLLFRFNVEIHCLNFYLHIACIVPRI